MTQESLQAKPFHIYDDEFYDVIGRDPSLTVIATSDTDPIFHEAVVWYPPKDEVFFVQNAGAPAAGTGLNKSSIIQKISLAEAEAVRRGERDNATVTIVPSNPQVINPNGMPPHWISEDISSQHTRWHELQGQHCLCWGGSGRRHHLYDVSHESRGPIQHHR